ncbi:alpha/beta hydrolase [Phenylobacterium sp.]|uniref:alpha/beta fold hydrolase n=1 Tax=Phenylobacterium sp. TaxID=1871053 RepID=UPI002DF16123|nr:alpha/beta hydrolase [Phenylobacterium sp.]
MSPLPLAALSLAAALAMAAPPAQAASAQLRTFTRPDPRGPVTVAALVRGAGPLVVLVPSLGRGAEDFDDLAARLEAAGFMTAAVEPRGLGASHGPTEGLTLFDLADDVTAVAHGLSNRPAVFVGHAFGNRVVRALAARHPEQVSRLVLLAAGGQVAMAPEVQAALRDVFVETLTPEQHLAAVRTAFFAPGADPAVWTGGWHANVQRLQSAAGAATPDAAWQGAGEAPMLIVQAADDLVAPPANAQALKAAHPGRVTVLVLPHAGHAMLPEQPAAIAAAIVGYLKGR